MPTLVARSQPPVYNARMTQPDVQPDMIARLSQLGDLRVWSVIITIFGDAVMPRGGVVAASTLAAITDRLSIKPEALRVALYRLAKDGWITRTKSGRNSFYGLSERGRAEFLPATRRIYANAPQLHGPYQLLGLPHLPEAERARQETALRATGFLPLSPSLFLGPRQAGNPPENAIALSGDITRLPDWARTALAPQALQSDYDQLAHALADQTPPDTPLDAVALRTLLIHHWRRLLLRHADLPADMMPKAWSGEDCRAQVLALHAALSKLADPWLDNAVGPCSGTPNGSP